jgi:hypothetical protein
MPLSHRQIQQLFKEHASLLWPAEAYQLAKLRFAPEMSYLIWEIKEAFQDAIEPVKCEAGTTESYFLFNREKEPIALFKLHNYVNEYIAFRLDHSNFAQVPATVLSKLEHAKWGGKKIGALQQFIADAKPLLALEENSGAHYDANSIRRIATLDIRLLNIDRHKANLLATRSHQLIPIDHELILSAGTARAYFAWERWTQATTPFSKIEQAYIASLDADEDRTILMQELNISETYANRLYVSTRLLQIAASSNFSAAQIGNLFTEHGPKENESTFCYLLEKIKEHNFATWAYFKKGVDWEIKHLLQQL